MSLANQSHVKTLLDTIKGHKVANELYHNEDGQVISHGYIEQLDQHGEYSSFSVVETGSFFIAGGCTNTGLIVSYFMEKDDYSSNDSQLSAFIESIEDLEANYSDEVTDYFVELENY